MSYIAFPFSIDRLGKVQTASTVREVWVDRVRAVLSTQLGDRVMRPNFGMDSLDSVLNEGTPAEKSITQQIEEAFTKHLTALTITRIESRRVNNNTSVVELVFTSPDSTVFITSLVLEDGTLSAITTDEES